MNVLIFGGGFLGASLANRLLKEGHQVTLLSRSPLSIAGNTELFNDKSFSFLQSTIDNKAIIGRIIRDFDFLFHLASDSKPSTNIGQSSVEAINNLLPTLALLDTLQNTDAPAIIFVSSGGAIYQTPAIASNYENTKIDEKNLLAPRTNYGASKIATEAFLRAFHAQNGGKCLILRPANIYGPGQVSHAGFGIVPTIFSSIFSGHPFEIWGAGETQRDYLYIDDFTNFCARVVELGVECEEVLSINVSYGTGTSILELISLCENITRRTLLKTSIGDNGADSSNVILDNTLAQKAYNWSPRFTLRQGLIKTWEWFQANT